MEYLSKEFFGRPFVGALPVPKADAGVTLSAVMPVGFSEIAQQHTAAAYGIIGHIVQHGFDAFLVTLFAFFIYTGGNLQVARFYPFACIYNIRCLFAWDIAYYPQLGKADKLFVYLLAGQSGTCGE